MMATKKKNVNKQNGKEKIKLSYEKIKRRDKTIAMVKMVLLVLVLIMGVSYLLLRLSYESGAFTVTLDDDLFKRSGLSMYESKTDKIDRKVLSAGEVKFIDNISVNWLPNNIQAEGDGNHNGDNYLAYSFYIENKGSEAINYWYSIVIDDVIKNVDKAIRVMVYRNDEKTVYAKINANTNQPEKGTEPFYSNEYVATKQRISFSPGDVDKFTIVVWIEGDDSDCVDALIGGDMKMHMEITEQHAVEDRQEV